MIVAASLAVADDLLHVGQTDGHRHRARSADEEARQELNSRRRVGDFSIVQRPPMLVTLAVGIPCGKPGNGPDSVGTPFALSVTPRPRRR